MQEIPWGKETLGALDTPLNELEKKALQNLDVDKLNDMAECLFALNNRHYGPIPGTYMVMCIEPNKTWCVGQLSADRALSALSCPTHQVLLGSIHITMYVPGIGP